jgi:hypothetical protein
LTGPERELVERALRLLLNVELATDWRERQAENVLSMLERPLATSELRSLVDVPA